MLYDVNNQKLSRKQAIHLEFALWRNSATIIAIDRDSKAGRVEVLVMEKIPSCNGSSIPSFLSKVIVIRRKRITGEAGYIPLLINIAYLTFCWWIGNGSKGYKGLGDLGATGWVIIVSNICYKVVVCPPRFIAYGLCVRSLILYMVQLSLCIVAHSSSVIGMVLEYFPLIIAPINIHSNVSNSNWKYMIDRYIDWQKDRHILKLYNTYIMCVYIYRSSMLHECLI